MVKEGGRGSAVRHLIGAKGRSLCLSLADGFVLEPDELGAHRRCRKCLGKRTTSARMAPIDFSEVGPEDPRDAQGAWREVTRHLLEMAARVDFGPTAGHFEGMAEEMAGLIADHHRDEWKTWANLETVEHPLGDLEGGAE